MIQNITLLPNIMFPAEGGDTTTVSSIPTDSGRSVGNNGPYLRVKYIGRNPIIGELIHILFEYFSHMTYI